MSDNSDKTAIEQGIVDGSAWANFCDSLKEAGDIILRSETPNDVFNRAEGYRYLTRLLRAGLESNIESSDPRFPRFFQLANETIKIGNDNPDNIYQNVNLDGRLDYRITGTRGTVPYISFGTKAGSYATTGTMEPSGQLEVGDMQINEDGTFEIIVSSTKQEGNWLPMREDTSNMVVRQTFNDRNKEVPAELHIECISARENNYLQPLAFIEQLNRSVNFVKGTANLFVDWMEIYREHINKLPSDNQLRCQQAGGDASIHYFQSFWKLAPDEALVVTAKKIPNCSTWNFQLSNYWMESLDYRYYTISVNKHSASYNADGSVTIVVAHSNPGEKYPNWLNTTGHDQGGMLFRWIEADDHPPVDAEVVKFADL
ncbi:DUF1214 domain-containing protein [Oceanicoccus sp. KOV_DT_Chl]|uniref:DUF1214 domain-containing protein n=1 Tax=Oceanicoccus sp. KOV_DT_Chl TaxID=1904639 RepID=UPI000C7E3A3A|nr:DUF1214 domain-containing protein [Oceanicoccus sp. KOV_DT_Chl]